MSMKELEKEAKKIKGLDTSRFDFDAMDNNKLKMEDTFTFDCRACGNCCRDREDILLSPYDLFRGAKCLDINTQEFFDKYCETYLGPSSGIPLVRLLPKPIIKTLYRIPPPHSTACPLLAHDGKCKIHKAKPTVCALFPLGRYIKIDQKTGEKELCYYQQNGSCRGQSNTKKHTVSGWLADFDLEDSEQAFLMWSDFTAYAGDLMRQFKKASDNMKQTIYQAFFIFTYLNYDMSQDFQPQFEKNIETFKDSMRKATEEVLKHIGDK